MMISIKDETLIPLRDAPKHLPRRPNGKYIHISALYRWIKNGIGGVMLESLRIGGTTYTSVEALQRFGEHLSPRRLISPRARGQSLSNNAIAKALETELRIPQGQLRIQSDQQ